MYIYKYIRIKDANQCNLKLCTIQANVGNFYCFDLWVNGSIEDKKDECDLGNGVLSFQDKKTLKWIN